MSPSARLRMVSVLFIITVIYSFLIVIDGDIAQKVMLGYCGLVLTIFLADYLSRGNHD